MLNKGAVLYVHCFKGHGRAGTVCALLIGRLYNLGSRQALRRIQLYHDSREESENYKSPAAKCQIFQVVRLLDGGESRGRPIASATAVDGCKTRTFTPAHNACHVCTLWYMYA